MTLAALSPRSDCHAVLDLDGVVYCGDELIPRAAEGIALLRDAGIRVAFCSNNSTRTRRGFAQKLRTLGIPVEDEEVLNSAHAAAVWLRDQGVNSTYVIGESGLLEEIAASGLTGLPAERSAEAEYVVVGLDRAFDYAKLSAALRAFDDGAKLLVTNRDTHLPAERGWLPGAGSVAAAVEILSPTRAVLIGKPQPLLVEMVIPTEARTPTRALMIGDRLDTDIACARRAGIASALVLTGVTNATNAEHARPAHRPDFIFDNLYELAAAWTGG